MAFYVYVYVYVYENTELCIQEMMNDFMFMQERYGREEIVMKFLAPFHHSSVFFS